MSFFRSPQRPKPRGFGTSSDITKPKDYKTMNQWLRDQPLVIAAYWDRPKRVDLELMLSIWFLVEEQWQAPLEDWFPYLADHLQVMKVNDDRLTLVKLAPQFEGCPHVQAWCYGEDLGFRSILDAREAASEQIP